MINFGEYDVPGRPNIAGDASLASPVVLTLMHAIRLIDSLIASLHRRKASHSTVGTLSSIDTFQMQFATAVMFNVND